MCRILSHLTRLLRLEPDCLEAHAASLKVVCEEHHVTSPVLAKAVLSLYLQVCSLCFVSLRGIRLLAVRRARVHALLQKGGCGD